MPAIAARKGSTEPFLIDAPPVNAPGAGDVLCRTLELGVCGTDREVLETAAPLLPDGEDHLILGHECLARVEQIGNDIEGFQVGDLVVPTVRRALRPSDVRIDMLDEDQYTERGIVRQHGFSAPQWLERPEYLFRVDDTLRAVAVLAEPLAVALKGIHEALAIQQARLSPYVWTEASPRVLVTGMGPIGFAALAVCRSLGWPVDLYGRDADDSFRARLVANFGGRYLPAARDDLSRDHARRQGYDLILECTGSDEVMVRSARALAARGVAVWLGSSRRPRPERHDLAQLMRQAVLRNHVFIGSVNAAPRDFSAALAHLARLEESHADQLQLLITARVAPEDSLWHYEHRAPQGIKTVLVYD
jgi:threonine dehydrogenase-like Zn-dependent dehydrogenase